MKCFRLIVQFVKMALMQSLVYRGVQIVWIVVDMLGPLTSLLIWVHTLKEGEITNGYTKE